MMRPWPDLKEFYEDLLRHGHHIDPYLAIVNHLITSRKAESLHASTSHFHLRICQSDAKFPDVPPHLRISGGEELEFRYIDTDVQEKQWHRVVAGEHAAPRLEKFFEQLRWFG